MSVDLILYVIAAVLFAIAAFGNRFFSGDQFNLVSAGLFFWVLTNIV